MKRKSSATAADGERLDLDAFLPYLVNVLASRLSHALARSYGERFGITIAEWRVIAHLARNEGVSVREIQRRVEMDKVKVSRAVARLENAGLVEKKVSASDRRLLQLALTGEGRQIYAQIEPMALAYERQALSVLTAAEEAAFRSALGRIIGALDASPPIPEDAD